MLGHRYISRCLLIIATILPIVISYSSNFSISRPCSFPGSGSSRSWIPTARVPELRMILEPHVRDYRAVALRHGQEPPGLTVKKAMGIYKKFHFMSRQPDWGTIGV